MYIDIAVLLHMCQHVTKYLCGLIIVAVYQPQLKSTHRRVSVCVCLCVCKHDNSKNN